MRYHYGIYWIPVNKVLNYKLINLPPTCCVNLSYVFSMCVSCKYNQGNVLLYKDYYFLTLLTFLNSCALANPKTLSIIGPNYYSISWMRNHQEKPVKLFLYSCQRNYMDLPLKSPGDELNLKEMLFTTVATTSIQYLFLY